MRWCTCSGILPGKLPTADLATKLSTVCDTSKKLVVCAGGLAVEPEGLDRPQVDVQVRCRAGGHAAADAAPARRQGSGGAAGRGSGRRRRRRGRAHGSNDALRRLRVQGASSLCSTAVSDSELVLRDPSSQSETFEYAHGTAACRNH